MMANSSRSAWERYESISDRLAEDAATMGSLLEQLDVTHGRKRDDLLATGLPRRGHLASRDRFLSQFIARTTRALEIYPGAICQYALATFDGDLLAITDKGLELAKLRSPVLDGDLTRAATTLSDEERSFFVYQVMNYVPGELRDFAAALGAVSRGEVTPDSLMSAVRPSLPPDWTDVMVRTHISGLIARLTEMGLLKRRWEGRNVRYEQGRDVEPFLARAEAFEHDHTH
jgi:DNA-binding transcriptional ArsR family regulator